MACTIGRLFDGAFRRRELKLPYSSNFYTRARDLSTPTIQFATLELGAVGFFSSHGNWFDLVQTAASASRSGLPSRAALVLHEWIRKIFQERRNESADYLAQPPISQTAKGLDYSIVLLDRENRAKILESERRARLVPHQDNATCDK